MEVLSKNKTNCKSRDKRTGTVSVVFECHFNCETKEKKELSQCDTSKLCAAAGRTGSTHAVVTWVQHVENASGYLVARTVLSVL